ncbi:cytochrome c3 family protein [Planctomycetota bacterium]
MDRLKGLKLILWTLVGLAVSAVTARMILGLGATTNLSDLTPWGAWKGLNVLSGIALAGGGFTIAGVVYVLQSEAHHKVARLAVLTAFLGYMTAVTGLVMELGLPWMIWAPVVFWQHHSVLFEVSWCVMLYATVLALEFAPVTLENLAPLRRFLSRLGIPAGLADLLHRGHNLLTRIRVPLVILGVALSTLHQSSLGSLFLIMPGWLHPLWYSPLLPLFFLISAMAMGLMFLMGEWHAISYLYRRPYESAMPARLGRIARWILLLYLVLRLGDLFVRGQLGHAFAPTWQASLFWLEILFSCALPAVLLFHRGVLSSVRGQLAVALLGVSGFFMNRVYVGGLIHLERGAPSYFPTWQELAVSVGIMAGFALAFFFLVERFQIWEARPEDPEASPSASPRFDRAGIAWLGRPSVAARMRYSMVAILAAAVGFAFWPSEARSARGVSATPVHKARGDKILWIDGNLDGYGVAFDHQAHVTRNGGDDSCVLCHHMNLPRDQNSGCYACHRDMYLQSDAFRHDYHASPRGARLACVDCHRRYEARSQETAAKCQSCHKDLVPEGALIEVKRYRTLGYAEAFHRQCVACHVRKADEVKKPDLPRCGNCHKEHRDLIDAADVAARYRAPVSKGMLLPPSEKD